MFLLLTVIFLFPIVLGGYVQSGVGKTASSIVPVPILFTEPSATGSAIVVAVRTQCQTGVVYQINVTDDGGNVYAKTSDVIFDTQGIAEWRQMVFVALNAASMTTVTSIGNNAENCSFFFTMQITAAEYSGISSVVYRNETLTSGGLRVVTPNNVTAVSRARPCLGGFDNVYAVCTVAPTDIMTFATPLQFRNAGVLGQDIVADYRTNTTDTVVVSVNFNSTGAVGYALTLLHLQECPPPPVPFGCPPGVTLPCSCSASGCVLKGNLVLSTLSVQSHIPLFINGSLTITKAMLINVTEFSLRKRALPTQVTVEQAANVQGSSLEMNFSGGVVVPQTVTFVQSSAGVSGPFAAFRVYPVSDDCSRTSIVSPTYSETSIVATLSLYNACQGLSTGAIIGICFGSIIGGLLVALLIALITRHQIKKRTRTMAEELRNQDLENHLRLSAVRLQ